MADLTIPREAVDAAARKLIPQFDSVHPIDQFVAWEKATDALNAAAPLIAAAELDRLADLMVGDEERDNLARFAGISDTNITAINDAYDVLRKTLHHRAAELRAQS